MSTAPDLPAWAPGMHEEVRRAVAAAGLRRTVPPRCWVGTPGGVPDDTCVQLPEVAGALHRQALRTDLVERALEGLEDPRAALAWLVRPGDLRPGDLDLAWWTSVRHGFARHGLVPVGFCLLNRVGWVDLVSGAGRTWTRVRA